MHFIPFPPPDIPFALYPSLDSAFLTPSHSVKHVVHLLLDTAGKGTGFVALA